MESNYEPTIVFPKWKACNVFDGIAPVFIFPPDNRGRSLNIVAAELQIKHSLSLQLNHQSIDGHWLPITDSTSRSAFFQDHLSLATMEIIKQFDQFAPCKENSLVSIYFQADVPTSPPQQSATNFKRRVFLARTVNAKLNGLVFIRSFWQEILGLHVSTGVQWLFFGKILSTVKKNHQPFSILFLFCHPRAFAESLIQDPPANKTNGLGSLDKTPGTWTLQGDIMNTAVFIAHGC